MMDLIRSMKRWQIGVLVVALFGVIGVIHGVYAILSSSGKVDLNEDQQLIRVTVGDLINDVAINGSLVYPNKDVLTFGFQGTVDEVFVEEGDQVQEGQPLASLDVETIAILEKAVAQARVDLREAEDALADSGNPGSELDVAQAEVNVANATLALQASEEELADLLEPASQEVAQAEAAVVNARIALEEAQEALDTVSSGSSDEDVAQAKVQVDIAETGLLNAGLDLDLTQKEWDDKVGAAAETVSAASEDYRVVFQKWLGVDMDDEEVGVDPNTLLESWGVDLASLFDPDNRGLFPGGAPYDDPTTIWNETILFAWLRFYPGSVIATCDDLVIDSQTSCVQREMDEAWDIYQDANDSLETVRTQATKAIANAEIAVTKAEESLTAAGEALADVQEGSTFLEKESAEKQLDVAIGLLEKAGEDLFALMNAEEVEVYARLKQIDLARQQLEQAEEELKELLAGADPLEVALREADVATARPALDSSLQRLENATIKAPWNGTVSVVHVDVGQGVNASAPVVEIVDPTVIEVDGIVDEIDVLFTREGARASVTMDALPGEVLTGSVSDIASAAQNQQGVVSYPIRIRLRMPDGLQLAEGLSAVANVVIREDREVLLVPLQALYGTFEQPVVRVMIDGSVEDRPVVLGNSDDFWAVVEEGLAEGEQLVMQTTQATTAGFGIGAVLRGGGAFGQPGGFGGGFGGGGGRQGPNQQPNR